jgi:hypothetical protein
MMKRAWTVGLVGLVAFLGACQGESMGSGGSGGSGGEGGEDAGCEPYCNPCDHLRPGDVCGGNAADPFHGECHAGACLWIEWTCHHEPPGTACQGGVCARSAVEPVCCTGCVGPDGICRIEPHLDGEACP